MVTLRQDQRHRPWSGGAPEKVESRAGMLSVVVAAKDEAESLPQLVDEIARALRPLESRAGSGLRGFEIVVVDDGSTDQTPEVLEALSKHYPELSPVTLSRNVGQSGASMAGFWASQGEWVGMLDADLQNDPADLVTLWQALPGYDAALGWRRKRQDTWLRRAISLVANGVRNAVLGQAIRDTGCSVRIFKRENALRLPMFHGCAPVFRAPSDEGRVPDRAGAGPSPGQGVRTVSLQSLEPFDPGGGGPSGRGLAHEKADPIRGAGAGARVGRGSVDERGKSCGDPLMIGMLGRLAEWLRPAHDQVCEHCGHVSTTGLWLMIGFLGQAIFTARFLAQWAASEKKKKSVVPVVFWWLSLAGGLVLLTYAAHRNDPVIVVGQSLGVVVYVRNLMLSGRAARPEPRSVLRAEPEPAADRGLLISEGSEARAA